MPHVENITRTELVDWIRRDIDHVDRRLGANNDISHHLRRLHELASNATAFTDASAICRRWTDFRSTQRTLILDGLVTRRVVRYPWVRFFLIPDE